MALSSPLLIGIYENNELLREFRSEEKTSDALIEFLIEIDEEFKISTITYANTPGSFMGLKISYAILKSFCIVRNIDLFAVSGFELNGFNPIKANKNLSFLYEKGSIKLAKVEPKEFELPKNLLNLNKKCDNLPNYVLDAI